MRSLKLKSDIKTRETALQVQSKLLPLLFKGLDENRRVTLLNIGPAAPETVEFFSQFKCRLCFTDLYSELIPLDQNTDLEEQAMKQQLQTLFSFPADTQFDICLFWDTLNYLNAPALRAFSKALQPFIHKNTQAHGFVKFKTTTQLAKQQFGIHQTDQLSIREQENQALAYHPHSQAELQKLLHGFTINKGTLLPDARLEILLRAKRI